MVLHILLMSERDETKEIWVNKEIHSYHLRKRDSIVRVNHEIEWRGKMFAEPINLTQINEINILNGTICLILFYC